MWLSFVVINEVASFSNVYNIYKMLCEFTCEFHTNYLWCVIGFIFNSHSFHIIPYARRRKKNVYDSNWSKMQPGFELKTGHDQIKCFALFSCSKIFFFVFSFLDIEKENRRKNGSLFLRKPLIVLYYNHTETDTTKNVPNVQ